MDNELYHYGTPGMKWGIRKVIDLTQKGHYWHQNRRVKQVLSRDANLNRVAYVKSAYKSARYQHRHERDASLARSYEDRYNKYKTMSSNPYQTKHKTEKYNRKAQEYKEFHEKYSKSAAKNMRESSKYKNQAKQYISKAYMNSEILNQINAGTKKAGKDYIYSWGYDRKRDAVTYRVKDKKGREISSFYDIRFNIGPGKNSKIK